MEIDYINVLKEVRNDPMLPQQIELLLGDII